MTDYGGEEFRRLERIIAADRLKRKERVGWVLFWSFIVISVLTLGWSAVDLRRRTVALHEPTRLVIEKSGNFTYAGMSGAIEIPDDSIIMLGGDQRCVCSSPDPRSECVTELRDGVLWAWTKPTAPRGTMLKVLCLR